MSNRFRELQAEIGELVPGVYDGMLVTDALELILAELKRLKAIEKDGACG